MIWKNSIKLESPTESTRDFLLVLKRPTEKRFSDCLFFFYEEGDVKKWGNYSTKGFDYWWELFSIDILETLS